MAATTYFRLLKADEIDVRVSTVKKTGCSVLLYKDARVDQNILDETFGIYGWQRSHQLIGDRLYCTVSVKNPETGEWISKQDVGTESFTEKEKGQASDSFKRACFNLGIGRELYTAPFIWIPAEDAGVKEYNGKITTFDRFSVESIEYDNNRRISKLKIKNDSKKKVVYSFDSTPVFIGEKEQKVLTTLCEKLGWKPEKVFSGWPNVPRNKYAEAQEVLRKEFEKRNK